jgi:hypothetical protein
MHSLSFPVPMRGACTAGRDGAPGRRRLLRKLSQRGEAVVARAHAKRLDLRHPRYRRHARSAKFLRSREYLRGVPPKSRFRHR